MVFKNCLGSDGGGSATGLLDYLLGLKFEHKPTAEELRLAHGRHKQAMKAEVGVVMELGGVRPSSVLFLNVPSALSAALDMDSLAELARMSGSRVASSVRHDILAFSPEESAVVSDVVMIEAARRCMEKIGYRGHPMAFSVHRDQPHAHVHVETSTVSPHTLRAQNRASEHFRMAKSAREVENDLGLRSGRGLYVTVVGTDGVKRVEMASWERRQAWLREEREERLDALIQKFVSESQGMETYGDRRDRLVSAVRTYLDDCGSRGWRPLWADVHRLAAIEGVRIVANPRSPKARSLDGGSLWAVMLDRAPRGVKTMADEGGEEHEVSFTRSAPSGVVLPLLLEEMAPGPYGPEAAAPARETRFEREYRERALEWRQWLGSLRTVDESEEDLVRAVREAPGRPAAAMVAAGNAVLDTGDFDRWFRERLTSPSLVEGMVNLAMSRDSDLVMLTPNTDLGAYTTQAQKTIEHEVLQLAEALCLEPVPWWSESKMKEAIAEEESSNGWVFDAQQVRVFSLLRFGLGVCQADAGAGKTSAMAVIRRYCEKVGRPVSGLATSQLAAEKLGDAAKVKTRNTARAQALEAETGEEMVPKGGVTILDEGSMVSFSAMDALLKRLRSQEAVGMVILDEAQLPNIEAGDTARVISLAARRASQLLKVKTSYRAEVGSEVEWMRKWIPVGGRAIRECNAKVFGQYLDEFERRGHVKHHADKREEVMAVADDIVRYAREGKKTIATAYSKRECGYANKAVKAALGLEGVRFKLSRGTRQLAPGDRIVFLKNADKRFGVLNGYTGTIRAVVPARGIGWEVKIELDSGKMVTIDPESYWHLDHGWVVTTHKAQGQGDPVAIPTLTNRDSARGAHVALTRCTQGLSVHTTLTPEKLREHLTSDRALEAKADVVLYEELEKRFGGPESPWAKAVSRAQATASDPLRVAHGAYLTKLRAEYLKAGSDLRAGPTGAPAPGESREEAKLRREEFAAALRDLAKRYRPLSFTQWCAQNRPRVERMAAVSNKPEEHETVRDRPWKSRVWETQEPPVRRRRPKTRP